MRKEVFQFLKKYSYDINKTNRLLVSAFVRANGLDRVRNNLINSLVIKEGDNDYSKLIEFENKFNIDSVESLDNAFEFVISPEEKIVTGAVYTPLEIRNEIILKVLSSSAKNVTLCDPACGCGGFLVSAADYIHNSTKLSYKDIFKNFIYGLDLKDYSITRTKIILSLLAIVNDEDEPDFSFNLFVGNALDFDWAAKIADFNKFDIIVGNPPYVSSRHIDSETKKLCQKWEVSSSGHPDLYIPFFEIGFSLLKEQGILGYITMNTFFKSMNGRSLRKYFSDNNVKISLYDFGSKQVFDSRHTYTCICILSNSSSRSIYYRKISLAKEINEFEGISLKYDDLDYFKGWNLQEIDSINKIESIGRPFSDVFKTSSGIATLRNNVYIFNPSKEDLLYFFLEDGTAIEKDICLDVINTNKLTANDNLESLKQKIIFPYKYNDKKAVPFEEDFFKLNYPCAYNYLARNKDTLAERDKGNRAYPAWYSYGRSQALEKVKYRLFFPHIAPKTPNFILSDDDEILFYNGLALISENKSDLLLAKRIMESKVFWFYITSTSKPYNSGFYSISRNYIKSFGIPNFSQAEIDQILNETCKDNLDKIFLDAYGLNEHLFSEG